MEDEEVGKMKKKAADILKTLGTRIIEATESDPKKDGKDDAEKIVDLMFKNGIKVIELNYSGSGDSGGVEDVSYFQDLEKTIPMKGVSELEELCSNVLYNIVNPDFNDSGSHGEAWFILRETGKLEFECNHCDVIETTNNSTFSEEFETGIGL